MRNKERALHLVGVGCYCKSHNFQLQVTKQINTVLIAHHMTAYCTFTAHCMVSCSKHCLHIQRHHNSIGCSLCIGFAGGSSYSILTGYQIGLRCTRITYQRKGLHMYAVFRCIFILRQLQEITHCRASATKYNRDIQRNVALYIETGTDMLSYNKLHSCPHTQGSMQPCAVYTA